MSRLDSDYTNLKCEIPISGKDDVKLYQDAILRILGRINVEQNDPQLMVDLKTMYSLLRLLQENIRPRKRN